jgi:hypothetical protein
VDVPWPAVLQDNALFGINGGENSHNVGFVTRAVFAGPASRELLAAQGWKRVRAELAASLATVGKSVGEGFLPSL